MLYSHSDDSRGQAVIILALVLTVLFISLALILNSAIYAENLATRETADSEDPSAFVSGTEGSVADAFDIANGAEATTASAAESTFDGILEPWIESRQRDVAQRGAAVDMEWTGHMGWQLNQSVNGTYTPQDGSHEDWRLAEDAESIAEFRLEVVRDSLYDATPGLGDTDNEAFRLSLTDVGGEEWTMYLFREGETRLIAYFGEPDGFEAAEDIDDLVADEPTCETTADHAVVDFRANELDGSECTELDFSADLDGPITVEYQNTHDTDNEPVIEGQYDLVVNGSDTPVGVSDPNHEPTHFDTPGGTDQPTAQAIVYSVSYAAHYESADISQNRERRYHVRDETYDD